MHEVAAIDVIKKYEEEALFLDPERGYRLAFSGGKDSIVIKHLIQRSGVKFHAVYNVTTIDPPELCRFIREHHSDVEWDRPKIPFFNRLPKKIPPTRGRRWCCSEYKEKGGGSTQLVVLGVRKAESPRRAAQWKEYGPGSGKSMCLLPILDWTDDNVWDYIRKHDLPYPALYSEGFDRLGCIGCPMTTKKNREREFARWPRYEQMWKRAMRKWWEEHQGKLRRDGKPYALARFSTPEELWAWWMGM